MRIGALFSGGKDSTLALSEMSHSHEVVCLITLLSRNPESYMFHVPNVEISPLQAKSIGIPLVLRLTRGMKEDELIDLKEVLALAKARFGIEGVLTGAIESNYQATRVQGICKELGMECLSPLWHRNQIGILNEIVQKGFKVIVSGVFAYPLDSTFLGRILDSEMISKLQAYSAIYGLNPAGEGGEIETTVIDGPIFRERLGILECEIFYKGNRGSYQIKKVRLVNKQLQP